MRLKYCTPCSILLLFWITCASLCWGQNGYATTYTPGVTDVTSYMATTSLWKILPGAGACEPNTLTIQGTGDTRCIGTDGYIYWRAPGATSWTQETAMGATNNKQIAVGIGGNVYRLNSSSQDVYGNYLLETWNGSVWVTVLPSHPGHFLQFVVANDNTIVGSQASGNVYELLAGGINWVLVGGGMNYVSAIDANTMCGTNGTQVLLKEAGSPFTVMSSQPASSGISGCVITSESDSMFAWGTFGTVKRFDLVNGTWSNVYGMTSPHGMATAGKGTTLALSNIGNVPYHLNVYAGYVGAKTSGYFNACPPPSGTCNQGTTHNGDLRVWFPHGQYGNHATASVSPTTDMGGYLNSYDFSLVCDPFFGDPSDPECVPQASGIIQCSQSGAQFTGTGANTPPPTPFDGKSLDFRAWDHSTHFSNYRGLTTPLVGTQVDVACGSTLNACLGNTKATCGYESPAYVNTGTGKCYGASCSPNDAEVAATALCANFRLKASNGIAWEVFDNYDRTTSPPVCLGKPILFYQPYTVSLLPCQ